MNSALLAGDPHPCADVTTPKMLWNPEHHVIRGALTSKKDNLSEWNLKMQIRNMWMISQRKFIGEITAIFKCLMHSQTKWNLESLLVSQSKEHRPFGKSLSNINF